MPAALSASTATAVVAASKISQALSTSTPLRAVGALYAVSAATVVPLTWWRTGYSFSVGYGLSIATMSLALLCSFSTKSSTWKSVFISPPRFVTLVALIYGLRLGAFIYIREQSVEEKKQQFKALDKTPPLARTPLALGVSLLYAFMVSPALFALRGAPLLAGSTAAMVQMAFAGVAALGMVLESVADQHKYMVKRTTNAKKKEGGDADAIDFVGPTTWSYSLCRHPNYLGEILHWVGIFGTGCVSFEKSVVAWSCGVVGLWGILSIMFGASSRLDKTQSKRYAGQPPYEEWKGQVKSSVIPLFK